jgi:hypothetical protein
LPAQKFGHLKMIREQDLALVFNIKRGRPPKTKSTAKKVRPKADKIGRIGKRAGL